MHLRFQFQKGEMFLANIYTYVTTKKGEKNESFFYQISTFQTYPPQEGLIHRINQLLIFLSKIKHVMIYNPHR